MKPSGFALFVCATVLIAQQNQLTDQGIVTLVQSGVSQAEIKRVIATAQNFNFDLRPVSTDALLKLGVSEEVIRAMAARQSNMPVEGVANAATLNIPSDRQPAASIERSNEPAVLSGASNPVTNNVGYKLTYDGGSVTNLKAGTGMKLFLDQNQIRIVKNDASLLSLPASAITEISYGQDVHRRVGAAIGLAVVSFGVGALMALTKSKKHYIGLTWDQSGQKGGAAFQADKKDYRGVLAGLEGVTGKRAVNSDAMTVRN